MMLLATPHKFCWETEANKHVSKATIPNTAPKIYKGYILWQVDMIFCKKNGKRLDFTYEISYQQKRNLYFCDFDNFCCNFYHTQFEVSMMDYVSRAKNQITDLTLEVRAGNEPAIGLYKTYGFVSEAVRKNYYHNPTEDALIMWAHDLPTIPT